MDVTGVRDAMGPVENDERVQSPVRPTRMFRVSSFCENKLLLIGSVNSRVKSPAPCCIVECLLSLRHPLVA